jgi:hypothetical protein
MAAQCLADEPTLEPLQREWSDAIRALIDAGDEIALRLYLEYVPSDCVTMDNVLAWIAHAEARNSDSMLTELITYRRRKAKSDAAAPLRRRPMPSGCRIVTGPSSSGRPDTMPPPRTPASESPAQRQTQKKQKLDAE